MFPGMSAAFDGLRRHDFPRIRQATHPRYPTYNPPMAVGSDPAIRGATTKPRRNDAMRAGAVLSLSAVLIRTPMRRGRSTGCAHVGSGHIAAAHLHGSARLPTPIVTMVR